METPPTPRSRLSTIQISKNAAPRTVTPLNWDDRMDIIRENMDRNICGIGEPWLYNHATIGTKELIEDYVTELALQVEKDLLEVPVRDHKLLCSASQRPLAHSSSSVDVQPLTFSTPPALRFALVVIILTPAPPPASYSQDAVVPRAKMLRFLLDSRQAFGRTALVMTGGMTLGLFHMGVVKCL
jgi:hypothetical protein